MKVVRGPKNIASEHSSFVHFLNLSNDRQCQRASSIYSGVASKKLQCKDSSVLLPGVKMYMKCDRGVI